MNKGFEYLKGRGISSKTIREFSLLYYDGVDFHGYKETLQQPFIEALKQKVKLKATFVNSIIMPVFNLHGELVTIYCRCLQGDIKFDCIPFKKSETLYGLYKTCGDVLNKDNIYITEGVFDFLMLWQYGITNAACALGTNLAHSQMCLGLRFTKNFDIIFDPDNAGKVGAAKVKQLLTQHGGKPRNIVLNENCDLDDYLRKHGAQGFLKHAKNITGI